VRFDWDEAKSDANLDECGFDFEFASLIFEGLTLEVEDRRKDYGERRMIAIGVADDLCLTVVYTDRQQVSGQVAESSQPGGAVAMSGRSMKKPASEPRRQPSRGRADLFRLRRVSDAESRRTSPAELADLPANFWDEAEVVVPTAKRAISLRLDEDVLEWFRRSGPRYQTRMNAVQRMYVKRMRKHA
jgi:uncharacterized protein (DUF4415 family)